MLVEQDSRRQLIDFLIRRWKLIIGFAAIERVHTASCIFAKKNNQPIPNDLIISIPHACLQIEVIKHHIISIVPEVKFIDYTYEAQAPLDPNDFMEVFIADHNLCITKIESTLEKMKII